MNDLKSKLILAAHRKGCCHTKPTLGDLTHPHKGGCLGGKRHHWCDSWRHHFGCDHGHHCKPGDLPPWSRKPPICQWPDRPMPFPLDPPGCKHPRPEPLPFPLDPPRCEHPWRHPDMPMFSQMA